MEQGAQYHVEFASGQSYGPADMTTLQQWAREGRLPRDAMLKPTDGGEPRAVVDDPVLAGILNAPPTHRGESPQPQHDETTATIIPYRNVPALVGYYLGLFSLLPMLGLVLAIPALVLGIFGLRKRARNKAVHGAVHAWIGVIMGGLMTIVWGGMIIMLVVNV